MSATLPKTLHVLGHSLLSNGQQVLSTPTKTEYPSPHLIGQGMAGVVNSTMTQDVCGHFPISNGGQMSTPTDTLDISAHSPMSKGWQVSSTPAKPLDILAHSLMSKG